MAAHVYHWKHGWIPLDHAAAKDHGVKLDTRDPALKPVEHRTPGDHALLMVRAVAMHGPDRSKWSLKNLKSAAQMGDDPAKAELRKRIAKAKRE